MNRFFLALTVIMMAAPAAAQTAPTQQAPDPQAMQVVIGILRQQRDAANDQAAQFAAELQIVQKKLSDTEKRLNDTKPKTQEPNAQP